MLQNNGKLENKSLDIFSFIEFIDKNKLFMTLPELQRPLAWTPAKIERIFSKEAAQEYFGNLVFKESDNIKELILLDGQQRMTTFFMAYAYAVGFNSESLLRNNNFSTDGQIELKKIFGSKFDETKNDDESMKKIKDTIGHFGYTDNLLNIMKIDKAKIIAKMKNIFISYVVVSKKISEYSVFVSLNKDGERLKDSDILKANFLDLYSEKVAPSNINSEWHGILDIFHKTNYKSLDPILVSYLSTKFKGVTTKNYLKLYQNDLNEEVTSIKRDNRSAEWAKLINSAVLKQVTAIKSYATGVLEPMIFKEGILKVATTDSEFIDAFLKFVIDSNLIYKPQLFPFVISAKKTFSERNADSFKGIIEHFLKMAYATELNKMSRNDDEIKSNLDFKFVQSNKFRRNMESYLFNNDEYKISNDVIESVFDEQKINYSSKLIWERVGRSISLKMLKKESGKSVKIMFEWFMYKDELGTPNFFSYKNKFTIEHINEKIELNKNGKNMKVMEKKTEYWNVVFLESDIHKDMNDKIKVIKKKKMNKTRTIINVLNAKSDAYKKSINPFTKSKFSYALSSKGFKEQFTNEFKNRMSSLIK